MSTQLYSLQNNYSTRISLSSLGASITEIYIPNRHSVPENIVLPSSSSTDYAGATIGPVAGRIAGAQLAIDGLIHPLTKNDGENTLHGGIHGLAHHLWKCESSTSNSVTFVCNLPDALDGFPGNRCFTTKYILDENNTLSIYYTVTSDKTTFVNITNHTYWNLSGDFSSNAYEQSLQIMADTVLCNDSTHIPTSISSVFDTVFDFSKPCTIFDAMQRKSTTEQLLIAHGYNNAYLLQNCSNFAAKLSHKKSGRQVTVTTDYPCIVLYSGGFLPIPGNAIALEAQFPPNSFKYLLRPGEIYQHWISFSFK